LRSLQQSLKRDRRNGNSSVKPSMVASVSHFPLKVR
jgi:hypothetical protein